jgi:transposase InsO family protein
MSRKGCSSDNAACEGFFGRVKNEMYYGRNWASTTQEEFICFLDRYIRWYNEKRIKLSLGAMSPVKYRQHLGITTQPVQQNIRISKSDIIKWDLHTQCA